MYKNFKLSQKSWKNADVLKPVSTSFLSYNLWLRQLWHLMFQHFLNFVAHIVSHNVRYKSLNEDVKVLIVLESEDETCSCFHDLGWPMKICEPRFCKRLFSDLAYQSDSAKSSFFSNGIQILQKVGSDCRGAWSTETTETLVSV